MAELRIPIAADGWPLVLGPLGTGLGLWAAGFRRLGATALATSAFMAFFFRDPERRAPDLPGLVLAPADGLVTDVCEVEDAFVGRGRQVSIFLSPLDVHVNRAPVAGRVTAVRHRPGTFHAAYRPEADDNEQTTLALEGPVGRVVVRQVAGVLARRIVCRARPGDELAAGQRFGMIKFGSRTDLLVPEAVRLLVARGDRVRGGETVVGVAGS